MATILSQSAFKDGLNKVKGTLGKPTSPALTAVHIKGNAATNTVTLSTTDRINSTCYTIEVEQAHDFEALVPAALLIKFTSRLESGDLQIDVNPQTNGFLVKYPGLKKPVELNGLKPADFPVAKSFVAETTIKVNSSDFKDMIATTVFAAAADTPNQSAEVNPLIGVGLIVEGRWLYAQATDMGEGGVRKIPVQTGHKWLDDVADVTDITTTYTSPAVNDAVYVVNEDAYYGYTSQGWVQLPLATHEITVSAENIIRVAGNLSKGVDLVVGFDERRLKLVSGPIESVTAQLGAEYPDLRGKLNEIRGVAGNVFVVAKDRLVGALERALVIMESKMDASCQLWLEFDSNALTIRTATVAGANGSLEEDVPGLLLKGKRMTTLINGKLVLNAAKVVPTERMVFCMTEAANICEGYVGPSVLISETDIGEEPTASYLLLPMLPDAQVAARLKQTWRATPTTITSSIVVGDDQAASERGEDAGEFAETPAVDAFANGELVTTNA